MDEFDYTYEDNRRSTSESLVRREGIYLCESLMIRNDGKFLGTLTVRTVMSEKVDRCTSIGIIE